MRLWRRRTVEPPRTLTAKMVGGRVFVDALEVADLLAATSGVERDAETFRLKVQLYGQRHAVAFLNDPLYAATPSMWSKRL